MFYTTNLIIVPAKDRKHNSRLTGNESLCMYSLPMAERSQSTFQCARKYEPIHIFLIAHHTENTPEIVVSVLCKIMNKSNYKLYIPQFEELKCTEVLCAQCEAQLFYFIGTMKHLTNEQLCLVEL